MTKKIYIHLPAKRVGKTADRKTKDAGFTTYDPREAARLDGEIKEIQEKIKAASKTPIQKRDLEQVLAKLKAERAKYHDAIKPYVSSSSAGWEVLNSQGKVVKTFPKTPAGREQAQAYLRQHWDELSKDACHDALSDAEKDQLAKAEKELDALESKIDRQEDQGVTVMPRDRQRVAELTKLIHQLSTKA